MKLGMRKKVNEDGTIIIYANAWTLIVDIFKWLKNKLIRSENNTKL